MKTIQFECVLLSDLVLNANPATEGSQTTLDFIPGGNFLGIVASKYEDLTSKQQMTLFHSGKVRFGDAHPMAGDKMIRTLKVPVSMYYPKLSSEEECLYLHHFIRRDSSEEKRKMPQIKQCRSGFYAFSNNKGVLANPERYFCMKSAYDSSLRKAQDNKMYVYEALRKGSRFLFDVEIDADGVESFIIDSLCGIHHIGRSRTAQYGLVEIKQVSYEETQSLKEPLVINGRKYIPVYADSRLVFLDENGQPTYQPTAEQLGIKGEIDWSLSQVRTFCYAPWNGKRQTRDIDRTGLEKGSVIVVRTDQGVAGHRYVGSYKNEGFGRVIYNPEFLSGNEVTGLATYKLTKFKTKKEIHGNTSLSGSPLLNYIAEQKEKKEASDFIFEKVNEFVAKNQKKFKEMTFASQWGTIRSIAMGCKSSDDIYDELFDKQKEYQHYASPSDGENRIEKKSNGYLTHGVAENKWKQSGRAKILRTFMDDICVMHKDYLKEAVVNLASEMAKISRKK